MGQIFHPSANTLFRVAIVGGALCAAAAAFVFGGYARSPYVTEVGVAPEQPVPFSHKHHVGDVGLDCRYCHTTVETSPVAGIPPTKVCMNCHSQIWLESPTLEPVRASFRTERPLVWTRVHDLPDFVYFDHSIHVAKGVGCTTCHGRVDRMPLTWREQSLQMQWCLDCHRQPERFVRPREKVFDSAWEPPPDQLRRGLALVKAYRIQRKTDCSTCHR